MFAPRCTPRRRRSGRRQLAPSGRLTRTRHRPHHPRRSAARLPFTTLDPVAPFPDKLRAIQQGDGRPDEISAMGRPALHVRVHADGTSRREEPHSQQLHRINLDALDPRLRHARIRPGMGCRRIAQYAAGGTRIERRATCRTKPDRVVSEITGDLDGDLAAWLPLRRNRSRRSPATSRLRSRLRFPQMRAGLV